MIFEKPAPDFEVWKNRIQPYDMEGVLTESKLLKAYRTLTERDGFVMSVSGKMAAGKDTIAPYIGAHLNSADLPIERLAFAGPLKKETTTALRKTYVNDNMGQVFEDYDMSHEMRLVAERIFNDVFDFYRSKDENFTADDITAYDRSPAMRRLLQWWGTDFRRNTVDTKYWVKLSVMNIIEALSLGNAVYMVDIRFPDEADAILDLGGVSMRIDVSDDEQKKRLLARDGIVLSDEHKYHPSETSLDDYSKFHVRVQTDKLNKEETVEAFCRAIDALI